MHAWHDVNPKRIKEDKFLALIEISKGSKNKYELDKESGRLILDRVLFTSTRYPQNYGFIPRTYALDNDPLDVLVICSEDILPLSFVECKPIGVLKMFDNGNPDEKIIAVPLKDPFYNGFNELDEIPNHIMEEIRHFFSVYKTLEGKTTAINDMHDSKEAKKIIKECINRYKQIIEPKIIKERKKRGY